MTDIATTASPARSIVFIDSRVQDAATLLQGLEPGTEVVFLQAGQDGLAQMADALQGRTGVDAIHVLSHGQSGQLQLGSLALDQAALAARRHTGADWQSAQRQWGHFAAWLRCGKRGSWRPLHQPMGKTYAGRRGGFDQPHRCVSPGRRLGARGNIGASGRSPWTETAGIGDLCARADNTGGYKLQPAACA